MLPVSFLEIEVIDVKIFPDDRLGDQQKSVKAANSAQRKEGQRTGPRVAYQTGPHIEKMVVVASAYLR